MRTKVKNDVMFGSWFCRIDVLNFGSSICANAP